MDTGEVRQGIITQVVFKNDEFLVRIRFEDKYWVLNHPDSDRVRILPGTIAMSAAETSSIFPEELHSSVLPENVFELERCNQ